MSVESEYRTRYRLFKLGNFGHNFEKVIMNLAKGTVNDLSKLSSLTYFMLVAKKMYIEMGLGEEADKLTELSDEWDHWVQISKEIERKKDDFDFYSFLSVIDIKLSSSFMYMKVSDEDYIIRSMAVSDKDMYKEYIINLLDLKQRELLYEILGIIWLNIHTNKQLSLTEIRQIVERAKVPEAEKLPEGADTTLVVDDAIDAEKVNFTPNAQDSTPLGFKKALRIIMPVIDIFKDNFYKDTELKTRCNNAEVYAFSVLITASKIMYTDEGVTSLLKQAYQICKNIHNYYLIRVLSKWKTMNSFLINHFESKYEIKLSTLILEMFEKAENLIENIQKSTGEGFAAGDIEEIEEGKRRILNYKRTKKELDPKHFVGWIIKHDDLTTITEILRSGEPIVTYDVEADPYHLKFSELPSISLILGMTGSGKSIWSIDLERSGINDGYTIWDCSMNIERSTEMLWCCMPLLEKYYKKTYKILTQRQGMHPEGLPMTILFPYYGEYSLPKKLPAEGKVITIPLYMLAKKHYALSLLFSSYPSDIVLNVVDFILQSEADKTWDLDTLRHRLTQLASLPKDEEAAIWINEQVADFKYRKKYVLDKAALRKALTILLPKSDLISSGTAQTAINFKELCISGSLVVPYLGGMPSKSDCMAFVLWLFNAIVEFASKSENKGRKIGILINEAQTVVPSQQLVGGALSEEKYGMSVEFASSALQWRGLALKVIINCLDGKESILYQHNGLVYKDKIVNFVNNFNKESEYFIQSFDVQKNIFIWKKVKDVHKTEPVNDAYSIELNDGRNVITSANNSLLGYEFGVGFRKVNAENLKVGDWVVCPRKLDLPSVDNMIFDIVDLCYKISEDILFDVGFRIGRGNIVKYIKKFGLTKEFIEKSLNIKYDKLHFIKFVPLLWFKKLQIPIPDINLIYVRKCDYPINRHITITNNLMWMFGLFVAEGYVTEKGSWLTCDYEKVIKFSSVLIKEILGTTTSSRFTNTVLKPYLKKKEKEYYQDAYSVCIPKVIQVFYQIFGFFGNSHTKDIPDFIIQLKDEFIKSFLDGYYDGDGGKSARKNIKDPKHTAFCTASKDLCFDIAYLCLKLGLQYRIIPRPMEGKTHFSGKIIQKVMYSLTIHSNTDWSPPKKIHSYQKELIFSYLLFNKNATVNDIIKNTGFDYTNTSQLLKKYSKLGYINITKHINSGHRRAYWYEYNLISIPENIRYLNIGAATLKRVKKIRKIKYEQPHPLYDIILESDGINGNLNFVAGTGGLCCYDSQEQGQLREQIKNQAGIKMMFHTTSDKDLDYAFGQVQNPQLKENLKTVVVNKFYKDEHLCCLPNQSIISNSQVYFIENIPIGSSVLTHYGNFEKVNQTLSHDYNGFIYKIKTHCLTEGISVTPEHPVLVLSAKIRKSIWDEKKNLVKDSKPIWKAACEISKDDYLCVPRMKNIFDKNEIKLSDFQEEGTFVIVDNLIYPSSSYHRFKVPLDVVRELIDCRINNKVERHNKVGRPISKLGDLCYKYSKQYGLTYTTLWNYAHKNLNSCGYGINRSAKMNTLRNIIKLDNDLMRLIGYFLSDGTVAGEGISFSFSTITDNDKRNTSDVIEILNKLGFKPKIFMSKHSKCQNVYIYSDIFANFLRKMFGNNYHNKHLPNEFLYLPHEKQLHLLVGLIRGDGCVDKDNNSIVLGMTSKTLMYQVYLILVRIGCAPLFHKRPKEKLHGLGSTRSDFYVINIRGKQVNKILSFQLPKLEDMARSTAIMDDDYLYLSVSDIEKVVYSGKVHNLGIENDESYLLNNVVVHNCTVITGPETENIKIIASAVPPCAYEIPNVDFFEVYEKEYPTRVIDTRLYLNQIADDKRRTFMNTIKDEIGKSIEILDEGKTLTAIDERETIIMKDTLNAILEETQKQGVPDGHTAVPNEELAKMHKLKKGELIVDPTKTDVISIRTDHYIDLVTRAAKQGSPEVVEDVNNKTNITSLNLFNSIFHIVAGCEPLEFILTRNLTKNSVKKPAKKLDCFVLGEDVLPKLGFNMSFVSYYNQWNDINKKTNFFKTVLEPIRKNQHHILRTKKIELKNFLDALDPKVLDVIYRRCAEEYYPLLKDILPWKAEVKTLAEKNSTNS